jgi:hypothetical protein
LIAKFFGLKKFEEIFKKINELHEIEGYTPKSLWDYRYNKTEQMLEHIKQTRGDTVYLTLNACL